MEGRGERPTAFWDGENRRLPETMRIGWWGGGRCNGEISEEYNVVERNNEREGAASVKGIILNRNSFLNLKIILDE